MLDQICEKNLVFDELPVGMEQHMQGFFCMTLLDEKWSRLSLCRKWHIVLLWICSYEFILLSASVSVLDFFKSNC
jgi:hypothetical protein